MIVRVEGAEDDVRRLSRISGYHPSIRSARRVGPGRWTVDAEVDAQVVPQIEAAGCAVTVILDEAAHAEHEARVQADIDSGPPIA